MKTFSSKFAYLYKIQLVRYYLTNYFCPIYRFSFVFRQARRRRAGMSERSDEIPDSVDLDSGQNSGAAVANPSHGFRFPALRLQYPHNHRQIETNFQVL